MSERLDVLPQPPMARPRIWQLALVLNVVFPPAGYAYVGAWRAVAGFAAAFVVGMVGLTEWTIAAPPGMYVLGLPGVIVLVLSIAVALGVGEEAIEFRAKPATVVEETLPNGARCRTLDQGAGDALDTVAATRVPDGAWYELGDNRGNAADSRVNGPVARRNICGTVFRIISSQDKSRVGAKP